jgi:hypothetical protein
VRYDPSRVNPQDLLDSVAAQGFTATVVSADPEGPKS